MNTYGDSQHYSSHWDYMAKQLQLFQSDYAGTRLIFCHKNTITVKVNVEYISGYAKSLM